MTNLVDELRGGWGDANEVCLRAAAEIERLQRETTWQSKEIDAQVEEIQRLDERLETQKGVIANHLEQIEVQEEIIAQLRGFAEAHKTCRGSDEPGKAAMTKERVTDQRLDELVYQYSGADRITGPEGVELHSCLLELQKLRSSAEPGCGDWRPIETCPKDGNAFLCGWSERMSYWWVFKVHWANGIVECGNTGAREPVDAPATHWMPLPGPPALKSGEQHE